MSKIAIISQPEQGVLIDIRGCTTISDATKQLTSTLEVSGQFWENLNVDLNLGRLILTRDEVSQILAILSERGVKPRSVYSESELTKASLNAFRITVAKPPTNGAQNAVNPKADKTSEAAQRTTASGSPPTIAAPTRESRPQEARAQESRPQEARPQEARTQESRPLEARPQNEVASTASLSKAKSESASNEAEATQRPVKASKPAKASKSGGAGAKAKEASATTSTDTTTESANAGTATAKPDPLAAPQSISQADPAARAQQPAGKADPVAVAQQPAVAAATSEPQQNFEPAAVAEEEAFVESDEDEDDGDQLPASESAAVQQERPAQGSAKHNADVHPILYLKQTLRSGQAVRHKGHVLIIGDVNPGAEVLADGDITIWGALRGVAHAGIEGDTTAQISALKFQPIQLRIAHAIARSPDRPITARRGNGPETARIVSGTIRITSSAPD